MTTSPSPELADEVTAGLTGMDPSAMPSTSAARGSQLKHPWLMSSSQVAAVARPRAEKKGKKTKARRNRNNNKT